MKGLVGGPLLVGGLGPGPPGPHLNPALSLIHGFAKYGLGFQIPSSFIGTLSKVTLPVLDSWTLDLAIVIFVVQFFWLNFCFGHVWEIKLATGQLISESYALPYRIVS